MSETILTASVLENPILVGLAVGLPGTALGYLGYRRAEKLDQVAAQSAAVSASSAAVQQVIDGLNHIVDNLQEDNRVLRESVNKLNKRLGRVIEENHLLKARIAELTAQLP